MHNTPRPTWLAAYTAASIARANCVASGNSTWQSIWGARLRQLEDLLPHGSGIDGAVQVTRAYPDRLVIEVDYHQMNDVGYYVGWKRLKVTARSTFNGVNVSVSGGCAGARDLLADWFYTVFVSEAPLPPHVQGEST